MPHEPLHPTHGRHAAVPAARPHGAHLQRAGSARGRIRPVPLLSAPAALPAAGARSAAGKARAKPGPAWGIVSLCLALTAALSLPSTAAQAQALGGAGWARGAQTFLVAGSVEPAQAAHDGLGAKDADIVITYRTNADWARLVLVSGGWPLTDQNMAFMLRWMRQENGPRTWWNRNNPLNNGYGSGGGSGFGRYDNLRDAARYAAENLHRGYPAVVAALAAGTSAAAAARAIWESPWASSHYAYGAHWSTAPVPVVAAPASAW